MGQQYKKCILLNGGKKTQAALAAGLTLPEVVRYRSKEICVLLDDNGPALYHNNTKFDHTNCLLLNRFSRDLQFAGIISELIANSGGSVMNPIGCHYKDASEKIAQMVRVSTYNLPIPKTAVLEKSGYLNNTETVQNAFTMPVVCKTDGNKGEQVQKISSLTELDCFMENLQDEEVALIQEYIPNSFDIRIIVAFGQVIGAVKRKAAPGKFLNNVSQGGSVELHNTTPKEESMAVEAVRLNKTDIAGVDLIYKDNEPIFLELNQGFGIEGFERIHKEEPVFTIIGRILKNKLENHV